MEDERILQKIDQLEGYLKRFPEILPPSEREYEESFEKQLAIERLLQISIEIMIDIVFLVIRRNNLGLPSDEDSIFEKVLPYFKHCEKYKEMKRFRNVLVHSYAEVDSKLVYFNAVHNRDDFYLFIAEIRDLLIRE